MYFVLVCLEAEGTAWYFLSHWSSVTVEESFPCSTTAGMAKPLSFPSQASAIASQCSPASDPTNLVPFPRHSHRNVSSNLQVIAWLYSWQTASALSTGLAAVDVAELSSLWVSKLRPNAGIWLSRCKVAHSAPSNWGNSKERSSLRNRHHLRSSCWSNSCLILTLAKNKASDWVGREVVVLVLLWNIGGPYSSRISNYSPNTGLTNDCRNRKSGSFGQPEEKHTQMAILKHLPSHRLKASPKRLWWRLRQSFSWHKSEERVPAPCRYGGEHRDHSMELIRHRTWSPLWHFSA